MIDPAKIAAETLEKRAKEFLAERVMVRRRLLEDAIKDQQIEKDFAGCLAGMRALGFEPENISNPPPPPAKQPAIQSFLQGRNSIVAAYNALKADYGITDDLGDDADVGADLRPEMPKIADIILDRLKLAGEDGSKSAAIRRYILDTYDADIHEKTVGMTLYRLSQENPPLVHRMGHVWFFGPAQPGTENPGAETPGSTKSN